MLLLHSPSSHYELSTFRLPASLPLKPQTIIMIGPSIRGGLETARLIIPLEASNVVLGVRDLSKGFQ